LEEKNIKEIELSGERVLEPGVTFLISHILLDNNARSGAFGTSSYLNVSGHSEVFCQTGTTTTDAIIGQLVIPQTLLCYLGGK